MIIEEDSKRDTQVVNIDALREALKQEIETSTQPIVIDGHYSHDLVENPTHVIVLRKAPWELKEILQNRLYSDSKVWENLEAEIVGVVASETLEEFPSEIIHEADTTGKTLMESADEIIKVINKETPPHIEPIDWITYPQTLRVLVNRTCTLS